jgi:Tol biopolymer transport system component
VGRSAAALALLAFWLSGSSCVRRAQSPCPDLPPGLRAIPGVFADIAPRWSPDGQRIAFLRRTTDRRTQLGIASRDLARIDFRLGPEWTFVDRQPRTGQAAFMGTDSVAWSPDGRLLAVPRAQWFRTREGDCVPGTCLWVCDAQNGALAPLAVHAPEYRGILYYYRSPAWSGQGRRLALIAEGPSGETALLRRALAGSGPSLELPMFDQYASVDFPTWSPDGTRLAYRQRILRAMTADPVELVRVISPGGTESRDVFTVTPTSYRQWHAGPGTVVAPQVTGLCWSPDGTRMAFALAAGALAPETSQIVIADASRSSSPDVPAGWSAPVAGYGCVAPVWIDDHSLAALRPGRAGTYDVVTLEAAGDASRRLVTVRSDDVDWSPDRRWIVVAEPQAARPAASTTLRVLRTGL